MFDSSKYLSSEEDAYLAEMLGRIQSRDTLMLSLLRRYGMRASELLGIQRCHLYEGKRSIRVHGLKGSLPREFQLTGELFSRVSSLAVGLESEQRIFPISYNRLGEIWRFYRPCKKPLHCLRHTMAVELYQRSKDIQLVQQVLGHKSLTSTMTYQQYAYTQAEFVKFLNI